MGSSCGAHEKVAHRPGHFTVALAGNPNCGKTSIFNSLTGDRQHVGNYPGVTVDSKWGEFWIGDIHIDLIDIPGVYSLSSSSPEENVVFEELMKPGIDLIINVIDATIPQRSMYLTTQLAELHIPMLMVLNMSDEAQQKGLTYDLPKLSKYFGAPFVETMGRSQAGVQPLLDRLKTYLYELDDHGMPMMTYGSDIDDSLNVISDKIDELNVAAYRHIPSRFFAVKLIEHDACVMRIKEFQSVMPIVEQEIAHLKEKHAIETETFMADCRYAMLSGACRDTVRLTHERRREISDRIDMVMTNKLLGLPIFLLIMYLTFWFTFTAAEPFMGWIEQFFLWLGDFVGRLWPMELWPWGRSLVVEGIISGVGGVLVFLPNILMLFFAIAILEDSGYMSRSAFVMDGIMRRFGLQGRSFVPLILGLGCNVPAIMATRCIESDRDRKVTIMVLPLMSCGARLPIYALFIPAFFPQMQSFMMWLIYIIGVAIALVGAYTLKRTLFKGDGEVYLMELPPYRMPTFRSLMFHMWDRGKEYVHKAGTIILFTSILLFICNTWPVKTAMSRDYGQAIEEVRKKGALTEEQRQAIAKALQLEDAAVSQEQLLEILGELDEEEFYSYPQDVRNAIRQVTAIPENVKKLENERAAERFEYTISGRIGHWLEPVFRPIGYDWRCVTASIGAIAAKEIFVSQLGIIFATGADGENASSLRESLQEAYTPLQALCIMLFCLLSVPCIATLAVVKREMNSWKMMFIEAGGLLALAWLIAAAVFQVGLLAGY